MLIEFNRVLPYGVTKILINPDNVVWIQPDQTTPNTEIMLLNGPDMILAHDYEDVKKALNK